MGSLLLLVLGVIISTQTTGVREGSDKKLSWVTLSMKVSETLADVVIVRKADTAAYRARMTRRSWELVRCYAKHVASESKKGHGLGLGGGVGYQAITVPHQDPSAESGSR